MHCTQPLLGPRQGYRAVFVWYGLCNAFAAYFAPSPVLRDRLIGEMAVTMVGTMVTRDTETKPPKLAGDMYIVHRIFYSADSCLYLVSLSSGKSNVMISDLINSSVS